MFVRRFFLVDNLSGRQGTKRVESVLRLFGCVKKKISHRHCIGPLRGSSSPFSALSRRVLNPIKPVYDPDRPDGRLNLTASAFNELG